MLLILTPNHTPETRALANYAQCLNWKIHEAAPTGRIPTELRNQPGTVYGEHIFSEIVANQMCWKLHQNKPNWIPSLSYRFLGRGAFLTTVKFARAITTPKYIQPLDSALFSPGIFQAGIIALPKTTSIDEDRVIVSDVVSFKSEYRAYIQNREVVSVCCTKYVGVKTTKYSWNANSVAVISFVNTMLKDTTIECAPGTVIDIGMFDNGRMVVIKSSPAWRTKMHGCEPAAALAVLKDACEMQVAQ